MCLVYQYNLMSFFEKGNGTEFLLFFLSLCPLHVAIGRRKHSSLFKYIFNGLSDPEGPEK